MAEPGTATLVSETTLRQNRAATPDLSAWVSANAGSGKTHVLARRVIRLLLRGARPSAILCLTYTKAAAAEMSNRVFRTLAEWVRLDDAALSARISELEGVEASPGTLIAARRLFAIALETPGGLKIQTIHAFCEAVLHRFPLEANVPGHFSVLDDQKAAVLLAEARRQLMSAQAFEEDPALAQAVLSALEAGGESGFDRLLSEVYARRRDYRAFEAAARAQGGAAELFRKALNLSETDTEAGTLSRIWPLSALPVELIREVFEFAGVAKSARKAHGFCEDLLAIDAESDNDVRFRMLTQRFFTKSGAPAKLGSILTKSVAEQFPDLADRLAAARDQMNDIVDRLKRLRTLDTSLLAYRLAQRYLGGFEELKTRQALLDYDDLIAATEALLSRHGAGAWVHYKLDQGIDHILVDEAQDTAPLQWNVIGRLAEEFFAGEGARVRHRTLFAVGDEKQSIYSFQGARPERFGQERRQIAAKARDAQLPFEDVSLRVSFRSSVEVLSLVDHVFGNGDARRGLGHADEPVLHETARGRAPGLAEIWPMIAKEPSEGDEDWTAAFDEVPETAPAAQLARRITDLLREWIGREIIDDHKTGHSRPVAPGDILVLVRKRDGFVPTLLRTLKARAGIPVAGADRLRLTDHVAVQDLIALGRFCLLEDDDLALAGLIKSPLLGMDEDALFNLCGPRGRDQSVWARLLQLAETDTAFAAARDTLLRWRVASTRLSPHDFFAHVLGPDGGRRAYLQRLGHEAGDVLDEFLGLGLDHEQAGLPGLQAFLAMLDSDAPEIKREMEGAGDAVRIMTVHAAKGLEAPIVFLVDSGGEAFQPNHQPKLWMLPHGTASQPGDATGADPGFAIPLWLPDKSCDSSATEALRDRMRDQAEEEYRRLLYVGLTRAADRLVVCGYRGLREAKSPTWHSLVAEGFASAANRPDLAVREVRHGDREDVFVAQRLQRDRKPAAASLETGAAATMEDSRVPVEIPADPLPAPRRLPRPLAPSGVGATLEEGGGITSRSPFAEKEGSSGRAMARGSLVHRLLQILPEIDPSDRPRALRRYLDRALGDEDGTEADRIEGEVLAVLQDTCLSAIFDAPGEAEVSVMGTLRIAGEDRAISGRIDRIAIETDRVLIVDYKTGLAPAAGEAPPAAHVTQLAIYRALLTPLYPDRRIDAVLIYVTGPRAVEVSGDALDTAMQALQVRHKEVTAR